ncbi:hypothetical protein U9M48_022466 [Paspalum notatum var. saurae]|uniref:Chromo domain-containing protein n=1 Tax=Paspalum notatum var. saurae TaxID=547442 RepID=A0AAQ3TI93_PASNO
MKVQADRKRSERSFEVGDYVWLKLQPYVQTSVAPRAHHKLSFRYYGPYPITKKIGSVAYQLQLPACSSVHPVFHVSLLKKAVGSVEPGISPLPSDSIDLQVPEFILDRRLKQQGNRIIDQVLVKWKGLPPELATWEDADQPKFAARGLAAFRDGENVTTKIVSTTEAGKKGVRQVRKAGREEASSSFKSSTKEGRPKRQNRPSTKYSGPEWT